MSSGEPFSAAWWDSRTLTSEGVDTRTAPEGPEGIARFNWIRWRLVDELLRRYYRETGLEPGFTVEQVELYNVLLWSPNCSRSAQYLGRLCAAGTHGSTAEEATWPLENPLPGFGGGQSEPLDNVLIPTWGEYLKAAIAALGLTNSGSPGHESCWHRRGKAVYPLVYRVALLLRTAGRGVKDYNEIGMVSYPMVTYGISPSERDEIERVLSSHDEPLEGPPRGVIVRRQSHPWVVLRSDGHLFTRSGSLNFREMWRAGSSESEIAKAIEEFAGW